MWLFTLFGPPLIDASLLSHQIVGIWHAGGFPWQPWLSVQSGRGFPDWEVVLGGAVLQRALMLCHAAAPFHRDHHTVRFRSKWALWRSQRDWKHFPKECPLKCIEWERTGVHPISVPLMNYPADASQACTIYVMTQPFVKLPTVVILSFLLFFLNNILK